MKYCVRPGAAGPRGRALSVSRLGPAASLLILLAGPASADGVSVNWDALGERAPAEEPLLLRQPGEKPALPVIRLTPPSSERAVPLPLAKPAMIPQTAGTGPETPATGTPDAVPARSAAAPEPEPEPTEPQAPPAARAEAPSATEAEAAPEDGTFRVALPQAKPPAGEAAPAAPSPLEIPAEENAAPPAPATAAPETAPEPAASEPAAPETETPQAGEPETETPAQVAALTSPEPALARILFDRDSSAILTSARAELDATAERLKQGSGSTRIQLKAYGGEPGELSSEARKLSLRRALAVYNYLRDQGVLTSRMDVRAFGGTRDTGPTERVDIVVQQR